MVLLYPWVDRKMIRDLAKRGRNTLHLKCVVRNRNLKLLYALCRVRMHATFLRHRSIRNAPTVILYCCVNSVLTRMPTPQEMAKTISKMHSFLRRMEVARDLLTPLSKNPTSRVPHSVLVGVDFVVRCFVSHRVGGIPVQSQRQSARHT